MCDHNAKQSATKHAEPPAGTTRASDPTPPTQGSRRRRMWDLPRECHCPVVGVCLPLATLRKLVSKSLGGKALADDYEIHVGAVAECSRRNLLSEALQSELEQRYSSTVRDFKAAKTGHAVAQLWIKSIAHGDVAGAFWAALTHPRCDAVLQEMLVRDMHMLQHQAGASMRVDVSRFNLLIEENAILARELGKVQERSTRLINDKAAEIDRLNTQLFQARADSIGKDSSISFLQADLVALRASVPDLEPRARLQKKIEQMGLRQGELEAQLHELRQKLVSASKAQDAAKVEALNPSAADATAPPRPARVIPIAKAHLGQKTVLCVGGRSGNVATYRDLIERIGGRFAHHDGGLEDNQNLLNASLQAADLVICQTGCISHNDYWRVKDFCKRTGKRCVFVENPSASSLARGLEQFFDMDNTALVAENTKVETSAEREGHE
ncbi:MAG: DUF2325 domain-containing protein [Pseudomonadota bacterium]